MLNMIGLQPRQSRHGPGYFLVGEDGWAAVCYCRRHDCVSLREWLETTGMESAYATFADMIRDMRAKLEGRFLPNGFVRELCAMWWDSIENPRTFPLSPG